MGIGSHTDIRDFMSKFFVAAFFTLSLLFLSLESLEMTNEQLQAAMIKDLESVKHSMSIQYAPYEWKKQYFGWDLEDAFYLAQAKIVAENCITQKDYRRVFKQFLKSTQDYHVNSSFFSTEWSVAPIDIRGVNGRYFVCGFNQVSLEGEEAFFVPDEIDKNDVKDIPDVKVGDEILAIDGVHIADVIENIIDVDLGGDHTPTGFALAAQKVFYRMGKYGDTVPTGKVTVTMLSKGAKTPITFALPWLHAKEWVEDPLLKNNEPVFLDSLYESLYDGNNPSESIDYLVLRDFSVELAKDLGEKNKIFCKSAKSKKNDEKEEEDLRNKGFLPPLGKILWEQSEKGAPLYAYLYQNAAGKKIGYIRLHSFGFAGNAAKSMVELFINVLKLFDSNSASALVIDITDNPGGTVLYMYGILSTLVETGHPLKLPQHREIVIPEDAYNAAIAYNYSKLIENVSLENEAEENKILHGFSIDDKYFKNFSDYALKLMNSYKTGVLLSPPLHIEGIDQINAHPSFTYKKPVLVLINELDFSCGDFFPAILQDNKRAVIFGSKTAGAGGYVKRYSYPSRFGVSKYSLTGSIAYRLDGEPIENLGVTPDVPYEITERDIQNEYKGYVKAVNNTVMQMLK